MNILLVDDSESLCEMFALWFNEILPQYTCNVKSNYNDALLSLTKKKYDLLITDFRLHDENKTGLNLVREFKLTNPFGLSILLTGCNIAEMGVEAIQLGIYDFVRKPLDLLSFEKTIHRANTLLSKSYKLEDIERTHIENTLKVSKNLTEASEALGINKSTIWRKTKKV